MKILVCIKQVPDMESKFRINDDSTWFATADLAWRMNEYDEYAVEQAVQLKEQAGDADVTVLCIGPDRVKETMKKALAMGCDRGVHLVDENSWDKDPGQIAGSIYAWAKDKQFDYTFCGLQSQDRGSCQVGILLAEKLGLPSVSTIVGFAYSDGKTIVKRELEGGIKAEIEVDGPALFTCQLGLNTPRYPTLPNIMKAKKKEMISASIDEFLAEKKVLTTMQVGFPEKKGGGLILEGDTSEIVEQLIGILKEKTTVLS